MESTLDAVLGEKGKGIFTVPPDCSIPDAVRLMTDNAVGAVLVQEKKEIVGILTERDLLNRVLSRGLDPKGLTAADVMTRRVITVGPKVSVGDALRIVTEKRIRHLPVMEAGVLHGLVSSGDLARWMVKDQQLEIEDLISYVRNTYPG